MNLDGSLRNTDAANEVEEAYSQWGGAIYRFSLRLIGNRDDAEDVLVETFVEAYRRWDTFKGSGSRRSWLYGIAANRARMSRRSRRNQEPLDENLVESGVDLLELIAVRQEVAKLPLPQRESFLLVKGEGLTAREASQALGRPMGTVLYEVHRALWAVRNALGVDGPDRPREPVRSQP